MAGLNDSSVDVKIEAVKATGGVLQEGVTGKEREEVGPGLVHQIFQVRPRLTFSYMLVAENTWHRSCLDYLTTVEIKVSSH